MDTTEQLNVIIYVDETEYDSETGVACYGCRVVDIESGKEYERNIGCDSPVHALQEILHDWDEDKWCLANIEFHC